VPERRLVVVSGGLRHPSATRLLADRLAGTTQKELARRGTDVGVEVVELREHAHEVTNHLLTGFASGSLARVLDRIASADGLIAVTPIFKASYSGVFKSFFDGMPDESLVDKPVLIAASGGTARHSLALEYAVRPLFAYLRADVVPTSVYAAPEDWAAPDGGDADEEAVADEAPPHFTDPGLQTRISRAAFELAALIERYQPAPPVDPFALGASFEDLLGGTSTN
jgi:FMN reductase